MTESGLGRLRSTLGWLAMALCLGAGLSLADSFIDSFRTGPNTFAILPGGSESLTAPLPPEVPDAEAMRVTIDHPGLQVRTTTQTQGFWMGNRMWQATVTAARDAAPGTARVVLSPPEPSTGQSTPQIFTLQIYPDKAAQDAASNSRIERLTGTRPLAVAAGCCIAAILVGCANFLASKRLEALWERQGRAVIYASKKTPDGLAIAFGLGTKHGVQPGAVVTILDEAGQTVGTATVLRCKTSDASALVRGGEGVIRPGQQVTFAPHASVSPPAAG